MVMKKICMDDVDGLESLLGEKVSVWCLNYIYAGTLVGVDEQCVRLDDASVVYETGPLNQTGFKDAQALPKPAYVLLRCIEMVTPQ